MKRHWQYLKYVLRHKWFVLLAGLKLGVPILILIFHDWDKFLPDEWIPYARFFYDKDGSKRKKSITPEENAAFAKAWLKHQNRNKHHWQYWMITWDKGHTECLPMPEIYIKEMLADWHGAGKAITSEDNIQAWYVDNYGNIKLHRESRLYVDNYIFNTPKNHLTRKEMILKQIFKDVKSEQRKMMLRKNS